MGRRTGRGAALTPALAATLVRVAGVMAVARKPWWVIGSAAVVLHDGATAVGDVDVLLSIDDADAAAAWLGMVAAPGSEHPLFRSARFFRWEQAPLPIEFMAGFAVRCGNAWWPVEPLSRELITVGDAAVFVPARDELRVMLARFGREKDVARAALLED